MFSSHMRYTVYDKIQIPFQQQRHRKDIVQQLFQHLCGPHTHTHKHTTHTDHDGFGQ